MLPKIDLTGQKFGYLTVIRYFKTLLVGRDKQSKPVWICRCVCGRLVKIQGQSLRTGNTKSCGCLGNQKRRYKDSKEQKTWRSIIYRCHNEASHGYYKYGARGIKVCKQWRNSFDTFLASVGKAPSLAHSIDRYPNPDGHYEPGNVRWATAQEQGCNRSKRR
jgi:hypothetical protein